MGKNKKVTLRISEDDLYYIDQSAKNRNMSRSQFLIDSALKAGADDNTFPKTNNIMVHLVNLSNLVNQIKEDEKIKQPIQKEVLKIWQSLN